jgi:uncharacterized protein
MIIKTKNEDYKVCKQFSLLIPNNYENELASFLHEKIGRTDKSGITYLKDPINQDTIKSNLANSNGLIFGVTENCNLRCKYCVYGGYYGNRREHNSSAMGIEIYKRAIDFFLNLIISPLRIKRNNLFFSFYGGEPMLELDTIFAAHDYIRKSIKENKLKFGLRLVITTNGILLTPEKSRALLERDFRIDISLDGPKEQHDILRIKKNNSETFDEILENISYIKNNFPDKYRNKLRFFLTIHPYHDIKKIEEFFLSNEDFFGPNNILISWVSFQDVKEDIKKDWIAAKTRQTEQINSELNKRGWFYKCIIERWLEKFHVNATHNLSVNKSFTGTCFPGVDRIFIDVDGTFHMCEKINSYFPIGNVWTGFDLEAINQLVNNWNENIAKRKCWECDVWWLCDFCYSAMVIEDKITIKKECCQAFSQNTQGALREYLTLQEEEDEIKNINRYSNINTFVESL